MKHILFCIIVCVISLFPVSLRAQIGYQVSLLNTATGEPRAGVTVNATVTITDSSNKVIYTGTHRSTSNDFGVLSLTVGNADTFRDADFGKLPFFISVSVDGVLIGKSQILSVPVAEYAKKTGELTIEKLVGTWEHISYGGDNKNSYTFFADGTFNQVFISPYPGESGNYNGNYFIDGNSIWMKGIYNSELYYRKNYIPSKNIIIEDGGDIYKKNNHLE